jgi:hypothetical protein
MKRAEGAANGEDWIAAIAALQFVALFWTIYILRRNTRIAERAYISGGGYFPNDPTAGWRDDLSFPKIPSGSDSRAEAESAHHPARCSHSFSCLECLSPTCSGRGASLKSRTSFFAISSILL